MNVLVDTDEGVACICGDVIYDIAHQLVEPHLQVMELDPAVTGNHGGSKRGEKAAIRKAVGTSRFVLPAHDRPGVVEHGRMVGRTFDSTPGPLIAHDDFPGKLDVGVPGDGDRVSAGGTPFLPPLSAEEAVAADEPCACWRPTGRWPRATSRRSTATSCSRRGGRCCARASSTSAASRCSARGGWARSRRSTARRRPWSARPGRSTRRATGSCPQYRELPAMLRQGYPLDRLPAVLHRQARRATTWARGRQRAALPDLAGRADPARRRAGLGAAPPGLDAVVLAYFGDGASSEGDAHEAINLAGRAPRAGGVRAQEQRLGDLDAGAQADGGAELRRARGGLRLPGRARRRQRPLRRARRLHAGPWRGRARARGRR